MIGSPTREEMRRLKLRIENDPDGHYVMNWQVVELIDHCLELADELDQRLDSSNEP